MCTVYSQAQGCVCTVFQLGGDVEQHWLMTAYTTPEVHNVSLRRHRRTEPLSYDREQTRTPTDTLITILRSHIRSRVTRTSSSSKPTDNKRPHHCCHLHSGPKKHKCFWELIYVYNFATVRGRKAYDMQKKSKFYVEKKYETYMSVKLNIVCVVCINLDERWIRQQHINFTQFFTQTDSKSNLSIIRKRNIINNTARTQCIRIQHGHPSAW